MYCISWGWSVLPGFEQRLFCNSRFSVDEFEFDVHSLYAFTYTHTDIHRNQRISTKPKQDITRTNAKLVLM